MRLLSYTNVEQLEAAAGELEVPFEMDEDAFRAFYDRTARGVWAYLARMTGDRQAADDLLQECYYRLLRAKVAHEDETHRKNYLFRIATNLARDRHRRRAASPDTSTEVNESHGADTDAAARAETRADLHRALRRLKHRERELLWLAYAQGSSHEEIGATLGLKKGSIKPLLFRARQRLASLLRGGGGNHA